MTSEYTTWDFTKEEYVKFETWMDRINHIHTGNADLRNNDIASFYDTGGSIGKRYRRQDEIGTPFCVVIDYDTLEEGHDDFDTVTVRHRDTAEQERVAISDLLSYFSDKLV